MSTNTHHTLKGANALRDRLTRYWRDQGFEITVEIIEVDFHPAMRSRRYDLRTNLINGRPPHSAKIKQAAA